MAVTRCKKTDLPGIKKALIKAQHGVCPICKGSLLGVAPANIVVDHDHNTGAIRAALHRGCNGMEGKILRFLMTWGKAKTLGQAMLILGNLVEFWKLHSTAQTEWIYYTHRTATEKRLATNKKRRLAAKKKREKI